MRGFPPLGPVKHRYRGFPIHKGYQKAWAAYTNNGICVAEEDTLEKLRKALDHVAKYTLPGEVPKKEEDSG